MTSTDKEILNIIRSDRYSKSILGAWIYGGTVIDPGASHNDVDLLVVSNESRTPSHQAIMLSERTPLSMNWIGRNCLSQPDCNTNGGFFFTYKFLAPHRKVFGNNKECHYLLAEAVSQLVYPWVFYLLRDEGTGEVLTAEEIAALLYLMKIYINPHYMSYFARWYSSRGFADFWEGSKLLVHYALPHLTKHKDLDVDRARGRVRRVGHDGYSDFQRLVRLEELVAGFWHFNSIFRSGDQSFLRRYFLQQVREKATKSDKSLGPPIRFLYQCLGRKTLVAMAWHA